MASAPSEFWRGRKKRVIKSIYTHCVDAVRSDTAKAPAPEEAHKFALLMKEPFKEHALKVALRFQSIVAEREFEEYAKAIQSNLPESTTQPPVTVPLPVRYLVVECTTMVAPISIGRTR